MTTATLPAHNEIERQYTWNDTSVFSSPEAWDAEVTSLQQALGEVTANQGRLAEGPRMLADALDTIQALQMRVGKLYTYAGMSYAVNTHDSAAAKRNGRAQALYGQLLAAAAFVDPELLQIGRETLERWMAEEPRLGYLGQYVDNLFRRQAHVRSTEVEELLGMLADPFGNLSMTQSMLMDADLKFPPAKGSRRTRVRCNPRHSARRSGPGRSRGASHRLGRLYGWPSRIQEHTGIQSYDLGEGQCIQHAGAAPQLHA
jgi:oligoendopeptidase F